MVMFMVMDIVMVVFMVMAMVAWLIIVTVINMAILAGSPICVITATIRGRTMVRVEKPLGSGQGIRLHLPKSHSYISILAPFRRKY